MKKTFPKLCFVALLVCVSIFFLPMHELCACLSANDLLHMGFEAEEKTDARLAQEVITQMEGFNIKKDYAAWKMAYDKKITFQSKSLDKSSKSSGMPDDFFSWINWLNPEVGAPGECTPNRPWANGQTVSCKFYREGSNFKKAGYQLDFRITPEGIIRDVKFHALLNFVGIEILGTIQ